MSILNSVLVLGALGLIFGAILAYASKKFAVDVDERVESILEVLPGANCGGCGFPGCGGLANAIVEGKAAVNACPVGGEICATKIGDIINTGTSIDGAISRQLLINIFIPNTPLHDGAVVIRDAQRHAFFR